MPIYEYTCATCQAREEKLEPLSAPDRHDCPSCGAGAGMKRQFSAAAVAVSSSPAGSRQAAGPSPCAGGACPFAG